MKEGKDFAFVQERNTNSNKERDQHAQLGTEGDHTPVENNVLCTSFISSVQRGRRLCLFSI